MLAAYSKLAGKKVGAAPAHGTVAAVYTRWLTWARDEVKGDRLGKRTLFDYEKHWAELDGAFGPVQVNAVTQPMLLQYFDKRSSKDCGKREIAFLGLMFAWAKPRGYMTAPNPVERAFRRQLKVVKQFKPTVPPDVYRVVWQCGDQLVRDTLDLSYMLATRPSEALGVPMPEPGATEIQKVMPKTSKRGRALVNVPMTPDLQELIDRRRSLRPNSLFVLFDDDGRQLLPGGMVRTRLYKAIKLAKVICTELKIKWVNFTRQQLRPTVITQTDKAFGRAEARKPAGHTTEQQTADYIRHEAETAQAAALPAFDAELVHRVEMAKTRLTG